MEAIVTHSDADGIISAALLYKIAPNSSIYFSSHHYLIKTLCNLLVKDYKKIKILDISPSKKSLIIASAFDEVVWIDHHDFEIDKVPENIKMVNEKCESTASLISKILNIENKIVKIADEIDTNNVKTSEADFLRTLISAIKWKFKNHQTAKLRQIVKTLAFKDFSELEKNEIFAKIIEEYKNWLNENIGRVISNLKNFNIYNKKILIVESFNGIPVYEIYNTLEKKEKIDFDILVVLYRRLDRVKKKITTKIEFRGKEENTVIELAKKFNGGGHKNAAGCIVNYYITVEELIKKIEENLKELNS